MEIVEYREKVASRVSISRGALSRVCVHLRGGGHFRMAGFTLGAHLSDMHQNQTGGSKGG